MKSIKAKGKSDGVNDLGLSRLALVLYFFLFTFAFCLVVSAQDDPNDLAPPPLKLISKDERARLDSETDVKSRTKLELEMMNLRLAEAEKLNASENYDGVFRELGAFHGLMDDGLDYLIKRDTGSGKVLDNFKRLEIALRGFGPRLEVIRRDLPIKYEDYLRRLIKYVRDARSKAIDPQFGYTVLPGQKSEQYLYL
ncbi:MAG: hypothetical protein ABJB40_03325 [Acidobacteriota bacterium]